MLGVKRLLNVNVQIVKFELCHLGCFGNTCVLTETHRGYTSNLIGDEMNLLDKTQKQNNKNQKHQRYISQ